MVTKHSKVPRTPPGPLTREDRDIVTVSQVLWRVHRTSGSHVLAWNQLRTYGPVPTMRYDPHPEPAGEHPAHGVSYTAADLVTALAEAFAPTRLVDATTDAPYATAWTPTRQLALLDLTDTWPVRNHAASALATADRSVCQTWARAIHATWPDVDGLLTASTWTGRHAITLWNHSVDSFPPRPAFSRPLAHPLMWTLTQHAATDIGYRLI